MMNKVAIIGWVCTLALFIWLIVIGQILRQADYFTIESLFYIAKAQIVHDGYFPKLPTVGITYPVVPFQMVLILFPLFGTISPMIASSLGISIIFWYLWHQSKKAKMNPLFYVGLVLFFFLNPGVIYLAVSGASSYMMILVILGLFYHLLSYIEKSNTYSIAMSGLFYMLLIFVDFTFIWLFIFFLPVILLITSRNLEFQNVFEVQGFKAFFRENNLRKFFIGKSLSTAFMFTILPVTSFLLYLFFNYLFTSHLFDFLDNANYNFRLIEDRAIGNVTVAQQDFFFLRNFYDFLVVVFSLSPFLILMVLSSVREPLKLYIMLLPMFIMLFDITLENIPTLTVEFFMLLCITSIFGIIKFQKELIPRWLTGLLLLLMSLSSVWFSNKYFQHESTPSEYTAYYLVMQKLPEEIQFFLTGREEGLLLATASGSPFRRSTAQTETDPLSISSEEFYRSFIQENETTNPDNRPEDTNFNSLLRNQQIDFTFDPSLVGLQDRRLSPDQIYSGNNPHMQAAYYLREITSNTTRVLADDGTSFPVVALHGRVKDFMLPYENDYVTFISNPEFYVDYILIPSRESFYQEFDMVYNVAPGLGTPDIPFRILFDNNVWMILETVNVVELSRRPFSSVVPLLPEPEPFHSVVVVSNDQSALAQQNFRRLRSRIDQLQLIPVFVEVDDNQWVRWRMAAGRFPDRDSAVLWRLNHLPEQIYHYHFHDRIDPRLFRVKDSYDPAEPTWSLFLGRYNSEEDAMESRQIWSEFGLDGLRIELEDRQFLLLAGLYNDFIEAELLAEYLSQQSYQRISLYEHPLQSGSNIIDN